MKSKLNKSNKNKHKTRYRNKKLYKKRNKTRKLRGGYTPEEIAEYLEQKKNKRAEKEKETVEKIPSREISTKTNIEKNTEISQTRANQHFDAKERQSNPIDHAEDKGIIFLSDPKIKQYMQLIEKKQPSVHYYDEYRKATYVTESKFNPAGKLCNFVKLSESLIQPVPKLIGDVVSLDTMYMEPEIKGNSEYGIAVIKNNDYCAKVTKIGFITSDYKMYNNKTVTIYPANKVGITTRDLNDIINGN